MPLFRRESGPAVSQRPVMTINGRPQQTPETHGTVGRRSRLFVECERRLADDPMTQESARGYLLGDGTGLERLTAKIAPLFAREPSLIRWVALRGAFAPLHLYMFAPPDKQVPNMVTKSPEELADVMGLAWVDGTGQRYGRNSAGRPSLQARDQIPQMPAEIRDGAVSIADLTITSVADYARVAEMSTEQVDADPMYSWLNDVIALDCIAWCAAALLRFNLGQNFFSRMPEPDALPGPGWYVDPMSNEGERYWDGSDWTATCRRHEGHRLADFKSPIR